MNEEELIEIIKKYMDGENIRHINIDMEYDYYDALGEFSFPIGLCKVNIEKKKVR